MFFTCFYLFFLRPHASARNVSIRMATRYFPAVSETASLSWGGGGLKKAHQKSDAPRMLSEEIILLVKNLYTILDNDALEVLTNTLTSHVEYSTVLSSVNSNVIYTNVRTSE